MDTRTIRRRLRTEQERLEQLLRERDEGVQSAATPADPGPAELSFVDQHAADAGSELFERQKELSLRENAESRLLDVNDALRKLDEETYGTCEGCGNPIARARLEAMPTARMCLEDQRLVERQAAAG